MADHDDAVYDLLDQASAGAVPDPPIGSVLQAGVRRLRRRRLGQVSGAVAAVVAVVATAVTVSTINTSGPRPASPVVTVTPIGGPSAEQLAAGRWTAMLAAPVQLCDPQAVWDGVDLIVFEPRINGCPAAAATYNPRSNTWATIAPPPSDIGVSNVAAWGGGQLMLVSATTGAVEAWRPKDGAWHRLPTLPVKGVSSMVWTGSEMIAAGGFSRPAVAGQPTRFFALSGGGWRELPEIAPPRTGAAAAAYLAVDGQSVLALVDDIVLGGSGAVSSGSIEAWRLTAQGWHQSPSSASLPQTAVVATPVPQGTFLSGATCPADGICTLSLSTGGLLTSGRTPTFRSDPPPGGWPARVAAGGDAVVATYPAGARSVSIGREGSLGPRDGATEVYDLASRRWLKGPSEGAGLQDSTQLYWTPYGVVDLAQNGRLLRPAK